MSDKRPFCSILQLSDTHLGAHFEDSGGKSRKFLAGLWKDKAYLMQAHDLNLLLLLPLELMRIAHRNQRVFAEAWPDELPPPFFDRVVVSGDVSTDATSSGRFEFAHDFLTSEMPLHSGLYGHQATVGLNIPNDILLVLPGNHDKMRETTLERFNHAFAKSPAPVNYVRAFKRGKSVVVFFVIDSNSYDEGNIARGEIDTARLSWLLKRIQDLDSGLQIDGESFSREECARAIRCLVLHHHVCDLSFKKRYFNLERSFTRMTGSEELLKAISGRIHLILHGHEHYPTHFVEPVSGAVLVSAGTTSQWQDDAYKNSFYNLILFSDYRVRIDEYVWTGKGFVTRQETRGQTAPTEYNLPVLQATNATQSSLFL